MGDTNDAADWDAFVAARASMRRDGVERNFVWNLHASTLLVAHQRWRQRLP